MDIRKSLTSVAGSAAGVVKQKLRSGLRHQSTARASDGVRICLKSDGAAQDIIAVQSQALRSLRAGH
ncbi:hypothetical protein [Phaeobacter sp.]|uniref:hypothetical protein n=1 Tax=Phaeobacter sp. TaxID=1902409 RepID=UPI0025D1EB1C|nr:hypothetical protein [Phaeobacter sp.]